MKIKDIATSKKGLKKGWTRATFIIKEEHIEKIRALSLWEKKDIKLIIDEALTNYLESKKNIPIKEEVL